MSAFVPLLLPGALALVGAAFVVAGGLFRLAALYVRRPIPGGQARREAIFFMTNAAAVVARCRP